MPPRRKDLPSRLTVLNVLSRHLARVFHMTSDQIAACCDICLLPGPAAVTVDHSLAEGLLNVGLFGVALEWSQMIQSMSSELGVEVSFEYESASRVSTIDVALEDE